ncbi:MAG: hypothetical protein CM15mV66_190 [uncultured marine virus]|nr:MAG: hypothetical protein CM15mV66_190 [uncultured marine virus]
MYNQVPIPAVYLLKNFLSFMYICPSQKPPSLITLVLNKEPFMMQPQDSIGLATYFMYAMQEMFFFTRQPTDIPQF